MLRTKSLFVAFLGAGALMLSGCGRHDDVATSASTVNYVVLDAKDQPLRDDFNRDEGDVRLMFLVDPRCPECLRGLADMGDDLLSKLPKTAHLKVYVIYEPVIGGRAKDIPAAAALLKSSIPKHYWNPTGELARQMSHVLGYWNGWRWVYAWDTWLIYSPDAVWQAQAPPHPAFLMHQLGGLPHTSRFPHLDGKVFAAKAMGMLAASNGKATAP